MAGDELDAVYDFRGGIVKVVGDDDFVAGFEEGDDCEGAYVAAATACL